MPDHTPEEKAKNKKSKKKGGIGSMLRKLLPGQLSKSILDKTNKKLKDATKK